MCTREARNSPFASNATRQMARQKLLSAPKRFSLGLQPQFHIHVLVNTRYSIVNKIEFGHIGILYRNKN